MNLDVSHLGDKPTGWQSRGATTITISKFNTGPNPNHIPCPKPYILSPISLSPSSHVAHKAERNFAKCCLHRRTQDFTMEGVHVVGAEPGGMGTEVPQWGPGEKPP